MIDRQAYLRSVADANSRWWDAYTLTDAVRRVGGLAVDMDLQVRTYEPEQAQQEAQDGPGERFGVLDGLRAYAGEHVLLIGRPGSGKSTALARLVLEDATAALADPDRSLPVLVGLRHYETSVPRVLQRAFERHGAEANPYEIEELLAERRLVLLFDGVNELPEEIARRDLITFREEHAGVPMIFTTRDVGVGGDLGIARKLEMLPLTEAQMDRFVRGYLGDAGEAMLHQLGTRLLDFGQTPLLLWMLCSLYRRTGHVPANLGLMFREFTETYERQLKDDVPIPSAQRARWPRLLQGLALAMTRGETATDVQVAIPRAHAERVLSEALAAEGVAPPEGQPGPWLRDLLRYHLIQLAGGRIEFRHQLIQEYYTAEALLELLPGLDDVALRRDYLNFLKWTEPLALMMGVIADAGQAHRMIRAAVSVDLRLAARLASAAPADAQEAAVEQLLELELPDLLRLMLLKQLGACPSTPRLLEALKDIC